MSKTISIVIFGSTGDLTHRKLIPALYNLEVEGNLPDKVNIIAVGRRDYNDEIYIEQLKNSVNEFSRFKINESLWDKFKTRIKYLKMNYSVNEDFKILKSYLDNLNSKENNQYIYYLAVSPEHFEPIVTNLKEYGLGEMPNFHPRLVIEKPFGSNLETAKLLNERIVQVFSEENTYRIDHYLGKEMLQNIMVIRFSNLMFEPLWNNKYIERVVINSSETIGIGTEETTSKTLELLEMVQSHLLQLVSLIAMEKPKTLNTNDIRDEKIKVLKH